MRRDLHSVADVLVSYSADQMPTHTIEQIHDDVVRDRINGATSCFESFQILDLLLKVAIQKLGCIEEELAMTRPQAQQAAARIAGVPW